jgi:3-phenylpropionate/trans-cinnamate dioxygenase ferredoxin reductase subunit
VTDRRTFVVVGASLAGATAAATLRDEGFDGRLVVLGAEDLAPYERPPLSKGYLRGEESLDDLLVRPSDWWKERDVDLRTGVRAASLDPDARAVTLEDGEQVGFDVALVATGSRNRRIGAPGADLEGVLDLRTVSDCDRIKEAAAAGGPAVLIGMGFIGAEVAASLRALGVEVTVVEPFEAPMQRALGIDAGRALAEIHAEHGVKMRFADSLERFEGDGRVERVVTKLGDELDAAFTVIGVGVQPNAELWPGELAADGGIPVGPTLETEVPGVFAAGDIASHEHPLFGRIRVEHFDNAIKMGEAVARNMLGAGAVFDDPHWFWSDQYDVQVQMVGRAPEGATEIMRGSHRDRSFCSFSLDEEGVLRAVTSVAWPRDVRRSIELVRAGVRPDPAALADPDVDLRTLRTERD